MMQSTNLSSFPQHFHENVSTELSELVPSFCNELEKVRALYERVRTFPQFSLCGSGRCIEDDGRLEVSYQKNLHPEGCTIRMDNSRMDNGHAKTAVQWGLIGDVHSFEMNTSKESLTASTDYHNFLEVEWKSTALEDVQSAPQYIAEDVFSGGRLKVRRTEADGVESIKFELHNEVGGKKVSFLGDCLLGDNEVKCELLHGDMLNRLLIGSRAKAHMSKTVDPMTGIVTIALKMQSDPLFDFLFSPIDLGEFTVQLDPKGSFNVDGNLLFPGTEKPLFKAKLKCNHARTACQGMVAASASNLIANNFGAEEEMHLSFEISPNGTFHQFSTEQNWAFGALWTSSRTFDLRAALNLSR